MNAELGHGVLHLREKELEYMGHDVFHSTVSFRVRRLAMAEGRW
jgi:hypothetical protein